MSVLHDVAGAGSTAQATSTATTDPKTLVAPKSATACLISVRTTTCTMTFDGSAPAAGNGHVIPIANPPYYLPVGKSLTFISTAAANSIVDVTWLSN